MPTDRPFAYGEDPAGLFTSWLGRPVTFAPEVTGRAALDSLENCYRFKLACVARAHPEQVALLAQCATLDDAAIRRRVEKAAAASPQAARAWTAFFEKLAAGPTPLNPLAKQVPGVIPSSGSAARPAATLSSDPLRSGPTGGQFAKGVWSKGLPALGAAASRYGTALKGGLTAVGGGAMGAISSTVGDTAAAHGYPQTAARARGFAGSMYDNAAAGAKDVAALGTPGALGYVAQQARRDLASYRPDEQGLRTGQGVANFAADKATQALPYAALPVGAGMAGEAAGLRAAGPAAQFGLNALKAPATLPLGVAGKAIAATVPGAGLTGQMARDMALYKGLDTGVAAATKGPQTPLTEHFDQFAAQTKDPGELMGSLSTLNNELRERRVANEISPAEFSKQYQALNAHARMRTEQVLRTAGVDPTDTLAAMGAPAQPPAVASPGAAPTSAAGATPPPAAAPGAMPNGADAFAPPVTAAAKAHAANIASTGKIAALPPPQQPAAAQSAIKSTLESHEAAGGAPPAELLSAALQGKSQPPPTAVHDPDFMAQAKEMGGNLMDAWKSLQPAQQVLLGVGLPMAFVGLASSLFQGGLMPVLMTMLGIGGAAAGAGAFTGKGSGPLGAMGESMQLNRLGQFFHAPQGAGAFGAAPPAAAPSQAVEPPPTMPNGEDAVAPPVTPPPAEAVSANPAAPGAAAPAAQPPPPGAQQSGAQPAPGAGAQQPTPAAKPQQRQAPVAPAKPIEWPAQPSPDALAAAPLQDRLRFLAPEGFEGPPDPNTGKPTDLSTTQLMGIRDRMSDVADRSTPVQMSRLFAGASPAYLAKTREQIVKNRGTSEWTITGIRPSVADKVLAAIDSQTPRGAQR